MSVWLQYTAFIRFNYTAEDVSDAVLGDLATLLIDSVAATAGSAVQAVARNVRPGHTCKYHTHKAVKRMELASIVVD